MRNKLSTLLLFLLAAPLTSFAGEQLIPAGSLISCTVSEPEAHIILPTTSQRDLVLRDRGRGNR